MIEKVQKRKPQSSKSKREVETPRKTKSKSVGKKTTDKPDKRLDKAVKKYDELIGDVDRINAEVAALDLDGAGGPEAVFKAQYREMLLLNASLMKRMKAQLEHSLTSRDIYALSTLMSQQREVIADLRMLVDMSGQVEMVQRKVITPLVSDSVQAITDVYFQLRKLITDVAVPKQTQFALRHVEELIRSFGIGLEASKNRVTQTLAEILLGVEAEQPKSKKKR